jgi:hypothetical protein
MNLTTFRICVIFASGRAVPVPVRPAQLLGFSPSHKRFAISTSDLLKTQRFQRR